MAQGDLLGSDGNSAASITNPFTVTMSPAVAVNVGDLVFAVLGEQTSLTVSAVTDNLGNTYSAQNAGTDAGAASGRAFYSRVSNAGSLSSVSFTCTASANDVFAAVTVYEGPFDASPVDKNPANTTNDLSSPIACPATGVLSQADELVVNWMVGAPNPANGMSAGGALDIASGGGTTGRTNIGHTLTSATTSVANSFTTEGAQTVDVMGTISFKLTVDTVQTIAATFGGAGALSAGGVLQAGARATLPGASTLRVGTLLQGQIGATFVGDSDLSVNVPLVPRVAAATFGGSGALSAALAQNARGAATFGGAGSFGAIADTWKTAAATFSGIGALSAFGNMRMLSAATFSGSGVISMLGLIPGQAVVWTGEATFGGSGALSANVNRMGRAALVQFDGAGGLSVRTTMRNMAAARFSGTGILSALVNVRARISATFIGQGALSALLSPTGVIHLASAVFAGRGSFEADGLVVAAPPPFYDYPIGRGIFSDYGFRASKTLYKGRLVIGRR